MNHANKLYYICFGEYNGVYSNWGFYTMLRFTLFIACLLSSISTAFAAAAFELKAEKGVLLVGTGATEEAAALIEASIKKITDKPIMQVINIGSQDHHWMGNSYFAKKGIAVTALLRTSKTQTEHIDDHLNRLDKLGLKHLAKDKIKLADQLIDADSHHFSLGKTDFELRYLGDAHFPNEDKLRRP